MDARTYECSVLEHKDGLYAYALAMLRRRADAQDAAQEALVRLWHHRDRVQPDGAGFWLRRTLHNLCIDRLRRRRTRPETQADETFDSTVADRRTPGPDRLAESSQTGERIAQALGELPERDRAIVVLREVQGLPYDEIAATLEIPLGTLKARLHRARHRLRASLVRCGVTP